MENKLPPPPPPHKKYYVIEKKKHEWMNEWMTDEILSGAVQTLWETNEWQNEWILNKNMHYGKWGARNDACWEV